MFQKLKSFRAKANRPASPEYRIPDGLRVYAIGDVHGCASEMGRLLSAISEDCESSATEVQLVFLGDLVDRGPASAEVIDRLTRRDLPGTRHSFLMGNHEEVMLAVLDGDVDQMAGWLRFGGVQTLESYGIAREDIYRLGLDLPQRMRSAIPEAHVAFLRGLEDSAEIGDYLFVHAGIRPGVAMADQRSRDLRWIRQGFLDDPTDHGRLVVHGHTISAEPDIRDNRIGVDTGCYHSGRLTALVLEGASRRFIDTR